ncbi:ABC transporter substrate-binding protein [Variovorax beijingensis]|uniref:ABC transporter substrate-binding protein n=1 Tax=Variovorax beijingensis TaxID=2496117 RepID=A0A3P3EMS6_9BURK|nr:ABC transporter substrate-binding protein [Variovorax beijingensis]RRH86678.1 ABC transporter substrate-binding protein [Variovorax beijingensis]
MLLHGAIPRFAGLAVVLLCLSAQAVPFKWASQDDAATMDPDAFNHGPTSTVLGHIYEGLVRRDRNQRIEPALASAWTQPAPTVWRFSLREGVRFHDGSPLVAEDVAFSIKRAMTPESDMKVFAASIADVKVVDAKTVDVITEFPNAALLQSLPELKILSKAWAEKNGAQKPADMRQKSENFATRNANGTGPFKLLVREPDVRTVLVANADWWDKPTTNITEATMVKISSAATRVAALLSGELDFAYPIPLQDIPRIEAAAAYKVLQGPEIRTLFLSMDQASPELKYSNVKGRNPFADRRVRLALYQAIDIETIRKRVMRESVVATGILVPGGVNSVDAAMVARPFPYDVAAAKRLLAEAGYPSGFEVTLDCTNDRYVNDEQVCTALAGMLARIGVKVSVNAIPGARFFTKVGAGDSSLNFFGYTPVNLDAYNTLNVLMTTRDGKAGQWNVGRYSSPEVDRLVGKVLTEMNPEARARLVTQAMTIHRNDVGHIPLYQQGLAWGMRKKVDAALQSDNRVNLRFITVR